MSEQSKALYYAELFEKVVFLTDVPAYVQKHHADAAKQLRSLDAEVTALRAQLAQGEPVAEFNGDNISFIPFSGPPLPQTGYLFSAPQQAPVAPHIQLTPKILEQINGLSLPDLQHEYVQLLEAFNVLTANYTAPQQAPVGYQLVPIEPTDDEIKAGIEAYNRCIMDMLPTITTVEEIRTAMLAAAKERDNG